MSIVTLYDTKTSFRLIIKLFIYMTAIPYIMVFERILIAKLHQYSILTQNRTDILD